MYAFHHIVYWHGNKLIWFDLICAHTCKAKTECGHNSGNCKTMSSDHYRFNIDMHDYLSALHISMNKICQTISGELITHACLLFRLRMYAWFHLIILCGCDYNHSYMFHIKCRLSISRKCYEKGVREFYLYIDKAIRRTWGLPSYTRGKLVLIKLGINHLPDK